MKSFYFKIETIYIVPSSVLADVETIPQVENVFVIGACECFSIIASYMKSWFKFFIFGLVIPLSLVCCLQSCRTPQTILQKEEIVYNYVDSVRYHDSTILIPQEYYYNVAYPYDSLWLETSQARAVCWVDSLFLRGFIENKKVASQQIIEKTEYIVKDSVVYREKPVPYPVEVVKVKNAAWPIWLWAIVSSLVLCGVLYWHFRKKFSIPSSL